MTKKLWVVLSVLAIAAIAALAQSGTNELFSAVSSGGQTYIHANFPWDNLSTLPTGWNVGGASFKDTNTGTVGTPNGIFFGSAANNNGAVYSPAATGVAIGNRAASAQEQVYMVPTSSEAMRINGLEGIGWSSGDPSASNYDTRISRDAQGIVLIDNSNGGVQGTGMRITATTFANLGTPVNGTIRFCSDCSATCAAGAGTGKFCARENSAWVAF